MDYTSRPVKMDKLILVGPFRSKKRIEKSKSKFSPAVKVGAQYLDTAGFQP